jgi:hypothetical protein
MPRLRQQDQAKERRWRRLLDLWRRSGLGVRAFCDRHDVPEHRFYWWRRELAERRRAAVAAQRLALLVAALETPPC